MTIVFLDSTIHGYTNSAKYPKFEQLTGFVYEFSPAQPSQPNTEMSTPAACTRSPEVEAPKGTLGQSPQYLTLSPTATAIRHLFPSSLSSRHAPPVRRAAASGRLPPGPKPHPSSPRASPPRPRPARPPSRHAGAATTLHPPPPRHPAAATPRRTGDSPSFPGRATPPRPDSGVLLDGSTPTPNGLAATTEESCNNRTRSRVSYNSERCRRRGKSNLDRASPCEMGEPEELTWWERFVDGLEEAVSECPVKKNEALRGEEGWKKNEMDLLSLLYSRVLDQKSEECEEVYRKRMMVESGGGSEEKGLDESGLDIRKVTSFREYWKSQWQGLYGSFEDVTLLNAMQYTYHHAPPLARPCDALQIFSAKVITDLRWPLHVFGVVALRDHVDRNRNLLFYSTRDNCQTLSETDPYLILTGPTRPVVVTKDDPVMIEVYLKVKGDTENEDKYLVYFADNVQDSVASYIAGVSADNLYPILCPSKHAMLEVRVGEIRSSVEATIFVRVAKGLLWPGGFHGHFAARTSSERQSVVLFDFGADMVPVDGDGYMKLSRHVVSVELEGSLQVYFMAWPDHKSFKACQECNEVVNGEVRLNPEKAGRSYANFRLGSFEMEVIVAWSLVVPDPQPDVPDSFENYPHRA